MSLAYFLFHHYLKGLLLMSASSIQKCAVRCAVLGGCFAVCCLLSMSGYVYGQVGNNPSITVDEAGNGTLQFAGVPPTLLPGVLAPDPGPGGLPAALTYNLQGPPGLIAGDVLLLEPGSTTISDIVRFNPAGTSPGYPASLVFYSDTADVAELVQLADTGFPNTLYTNTMTIREILLPGNMHQATYTPGPNDPGFVPGFGVSYTFNSSVPVPEPSTAMLAAFGFAGLAAWGWRRRR